MVPSKPHVLPKAIGCTDWGEECVGNSRQLSDHAAASSSPPWFSHEQYTETAPQAVFGRDSRKEAVWQQVLTCGAYLCFPDRLYRMPLVGCSYKNLLRFHVLS